MLKGRGEGRESGTFWVEGGREREREGRKEGKRDGGREGGWEESINYVWKERLLKGGWKVERQQVYIYDVLLVCFRDP